MQQFVVEENQDGKSLIRVVLAHYPSLAIGQVRQALRKRDVRINGRRTSNDEPLAAGDLIALYLPDDLILGTDKTAAAKNSKPLYEIVYQDPMIIIVNKRPGVTVHEIGNGKEQGPFLIDQMRLDLKEPGLELCHRLDRQTGGLLLVARKPAALQAVKSLMQDDLLTKRYRCLVKDVPTAGEPVIASDGSKFLELTAWLEKDAAHSDVYIHNIKQPGDLPIITRYNIINIHSSVGPCGEDIAELEVELVTGRTHQIRAHLAHIGHPLLGDGKYGRNSFNRHFRGQDGALRHQQLFATTLSFSSQCKGTLAYLAGRTFKIDPDYDWKKSG